MKKSGEILLKEYVQHILKEDDYGPMDTAGMMGSSYQGDLFKVFGSPFVDAVQTAIGKTKELTTRAKTLVKVVWGTIVTTLNPMLRADYAGVFDEEKEEINKIRNDYSEVYKRNDEAFKGDAVALAFMASPALVMGAFTAKAAPKVAKSLLSATTGGFSDQLYDATKEKLQKTGRWMLGNKGAKAPKKTSRESGGKSRNPSDLWGESQQITEDDSNEKNQKGGFTPQKLMKNPKFLTKVYSSPEAEKMKKTATEIYRKSLDQIYNQAEGVLKNAKSPQDLQNLMKKNKKEIPEIKKLSELEGKEKQEAEKSIMKTIRASMKQFYIKSLEDKVQEVLKQGVPEDAQYVKDYRSTIQKIKAL